MRIIATKFPEVVLLEPRVFEDERGFFYESFNQLALNAGLANLGFSATFVQDNHSFSKQHVLRGLHYQLQHAQGKIVRVTQGSVFDVVVDLRRSSTTFGCWDGAILSADNRLQLWIPPGFAHGFLCLSEQCDVLYKTTDYWAPEHERCLRWDDPALGIAWPLTAAPILSARDQAGLSLVDAETYA